MKARPMTTWVWLDYILFHICGIMILEVNHTKPHFISQSPKFLLILQEYNSKQLDVRLDSNLVPMKLALMLQHNKLLDNYNS